MAIETVITEAVVHAGVGVVVALADFLTARFSNPVKARIQQKTRYLQAIEQILDAETPQANQPQPDGEMSAADVAASAVPQPAALSKNSAEYAEQVAVVREYLRRSGLVKFQTPVFQRITDGVRSLLTHEKINTLANLPKFGLAAVVEILYDVVFEFQMHGAAGIAASLYQIPALFAGMWAGTGVNKLLNLFLSSADERKIEKTLKKLRQETAIVELVMNYEPPETVNAELASRGVNLYVSHLTQAGKGAYKHLQRLAETAKDAAGAAQKVADAAQKTVDDVLHFPEKQQEKDAQEREARRQRFDDLTNGH